MRLADLPRDTPTCPVDRTLQVLEGRWATLIVRELLDGPERFGELRAALTGIGPKTLTDRLRHLQDRGVLTRSAYAEMPPRVVYELTEHGRTLEPVLLAMWSWGRDQLLPDGPNPLRARATSSSAPARPRRGACD